MRFPLFVELPGWKGIEPSGQTTKISAGGIVALREYQRGDARLYANVIVWPSKLRTETAPAITIENSERRIRVSIIDGWQVATTFTFKDKMSSVTVTLAANGRFSLIAKDVGEDATLTLARRFDWKALQATTSTFASAN